MVKTLLTSIDVNFPSLVASFGSSSAIWSPQNVWNFFPFSPALSVDILYNDVIGTNIPIAYLLDDVRLAYFTTKPRLGTKFFAFLLFAR